MKNPRGALACVFLILVSAAAAPLMAQSVARSQLEGRITDASGLPIARARITVAGPTLFGAGVDVESESQGEYRVAGLPPGTYDLRVKAPGFEAATRPGVVLPAGATYVIDVRMAVAAGFELFGGFRLQPIAVGGDERPEHRGRRERADRQEDLIGVLSSRHDGRCARASALADDCSRRLKLLRCHMRAGGRHDSAWVLRCRRDAVRA